MCCCCYKQPLVCFRDVLCEYEYGCRHREDAARRVNRHRALISAHLWFDGFFLFLCFCFVFLLPFFLVFFSARLEPKACCFCGGHAGSRVEAHRGMARVTCAFAEDPFVTSHRLAPWISTRFPPEPRGKRRLQRAVCHQKMEDLSRQEKASVR